MASAWTAPRSTPTGRAGTKNWTSARAAERVCSGTQMRVRASPLVLRQSRSGGATKTAAAGGALTSTRRSLTGTGRRAGSVRTMHRTGLRPWDAACGRVMDPHRFGVHRITTRSATARHVKLLTEARYRISIRILGSAFPSARQMLLWRIQGRACCATRETSYARSGTIRRRPAWPSARGCFLATRAFRAARRC